MRNIANPTEFRNNISNKLNAIINDDTLCLNVERGIFNYSLKESTSKKIIKKWENPRFVQIYLDRLRSIYMNLKNPTFLNQIKKNIISFRYIFGVKIRIIIIFSPTNTVHNYIIGL